jgi:hypothetical protein
MTPWGRVGARATRWGDEARAGVSSEELPLLAR